MFLLLAACQQPDLSQEWQLDRLRLLAIRPEPAEPRPGDTVTFTSLAYVPDGAEWSSVWIACLLEGEAGCNFDTSLLDRFADFDTMTPEEQAELIAELQAAGFIGFEPGLTPTWPIPADALDALTEDEKLEGLSASVQVTLVTEEDTELTLKSVPVSLATTPNSNPDVTSLTVDGVATDTGTASVAHGSQLTLKATSAPEDYTYVTTEGVSETRTEELSWRWYTDGGDLSWDDGFLADTTDTSTSTATWIVTDDPGDYVVHAVVLDGRGGMGWRSVNVSVE
jgi:hypothetical protein